MNGHASNALSEVWHHFPRKEPHRLLRQFRIDVRKVHHALQIVHSDFTSVLFDLADAMLWVAQDEAFAKSFQADLSGARYGLSAVVL